MPGYSVLAAGAAGVGVVLFVATGMPAVGLAFLVAAIGLALIPRFDRRRAARVASLAGAGTPATARVISVEPLGTRGGVPRVKVGYEITPVGRPAYRLTTRHVLAPALRNRLVPGAVLDVRVDPENPKNVVMVDG